MKKYPWAKEALVMTVFVIFFALSFVFHRVFVATFPGIPSLVFSLFTLFFGFAIVWQHVNMFRRLDLFRQEFLTIISHSFRTPLTAIKWASARLSDPLTDTEKTEVRKQIEVADNRIIQIIEMLTHLSKIADDKYYAAEAVAFNEIIEPILAKFSQSIEKKKLALQLSIPSSLPLVVTDKMLMQFPIEIVLENAIKYTPEGGGIAVRVYKAKRSLVVAVQDSGMGLTKEEKEHLFTQFYRSPRARTHDTEGLGLGLHIAKRIVERGSGRIWVDSNGKDMGTVFYISLPTQ